MTGVDKHSGMKMCICDFCKSKFVDFPFKLVRRKTPINTLVWKKKSIKEWFCSKDCKQEMEELYERQQDGL